MTDRTSDYGINLFAIKPPMDSTSLKMNLDHALSPRLTKAGLKYHGNYLWLSSNENSIRKVSTYNLLQGNQGPISWGVCFDFIPTISANKLKIHKTDKSVVLHLFEWTDEYA